MFIKSLKLHNIRSYENAEINFPLGSVLLAGDIGSGKSSILLAIEFAIFGAKKGELPAYTLLRHGKREGSVELKMQIDGREAIIKRTLKKSNDDIKQDAGYVIVNGIKKEGTSEELRANVLNMLGYPKDLVKKGKDFIYRYTVYTPQEEMKQILYESNEVRLDTLRKVFNIDKYKRIRENSRIIVASLREGKRHLEGFVLDLEFKKKDLEERRLELLEIEKNIEGIIPKIVDIKKMLDSKKTSAEAFESDIKELNSLRKELSVTEANLDYKIEQNNRLNNEIKKLESQIAQQKTDLGSKDMAEMEKIAKKIEQKEDESKEAENKYAAAIKKIREFEVKIEQCTETIKKIERLDICPVCEQKVDENHKHEVSSREAKRHDELLAQIKMHAKEESMLEKAKLELKKEIDLLMKEQNHFSIARIKIENLNEKANSKNERIALKEANKKEIGSINVRKLDLAKKINKYFETEGKYKLIKKEIDELLPQERFLELEKRKYETQRDSGKKFVAILEKEIGQKQKAKEKLAHISSLVNWMDEMFSNLMSTMERHVMVNIHLKFNDLFKDWFDILMEDESISVRVDEEFTPIIEQNGYETFIENLSGGEKTSAALSYRLALNKVINEIVADIKTRDIIMLDEPTDGFSTEQLDKVRDVLEKLNVKQVIIVSHEGKIESFVDNVIRVSKSDGVSIAA